MYFSALRLSGFKSFLEPTELEIGPGLTGIVGPNGCGKSNLVEAMRWVMGESSAKRMRGGEMDDVIFGGSDKRPARNLAEVSLVVDNGERNAPSGFNESDELEILRRIERGSGSDYRVNGKSVRAKDVALLFQDSGTGPHSASLVSQGRISAIMNAKPTERRQLLEEAAGITGLHTRRHEAELRLKQAEVNLTRVDDVLGTMDVQLQLLKKQSRQASRYRNINAEVRRQEAALLHLRWLALKDDVVRANQAFKEADATVAELMLQVAALENARLAAAEDLPPLRQQEAEAAAGLQRLVIAREQIDAEQKRVATAIEAAEAQARLAEADRLREAHLAEDALKTIEGIDQEKAALVVASEGVEEKREVLGQLLAKAVADRQAAEEAVNQLQQQVARAEAEANAAERRFNDVKQRHQRAEQRRAQIAAERERLEAEQMSDLFVDAAHREAQAAEARLTESAATIEAAEQQRVLADTAVGLCRERTQQAEAATARLAAERKALERVLSAGSSEHPPILDNVIAERGYEQALAAALGEDLSLPADAQAEAYWLALPPYGQAVSWPVGAAPLAAYVTAPKELARRLSMVGVVESAAAAAHLVAQLQPGQILVTRDGAAWRWDGVVVKAGAPTVAALRLQQKNRLAELGAEEEVATQKLEEERSLLTSSLNDATAATGAVRLAREQHNAALAELTRARRAASEAEAALSAQMTRITAVREAEERSAAELAVITAELTEIEQLKASLPDLSVTRTQLLESRNQLYAVQSVAAEADAARRQFEHEALQRGQRIATLTADKERWLSRAEGARGRMDELASRAAEAKAEIESLAARPARLEAERAALVEKIGEAEERRRSAADHLVVAETTLHSRERELKFAENAMSEARELRAAAQAQVGSIQQSEAVLSERIAEKCECAPEALFALAELKEDEPLPMAHTLEARLEKLLRERDALGPVNLRAEQEAEEQQALMDRMQSEKTDLIEAIAKLRSGISSLNREARERLLEAYGRVQAHFKTLFVQLFGGGTAELRLTEAEDPLEAGLEIIASPPGKKLQNLNLLSGGEQALTSLALLFAVFLVNPSPICVLDEVDAPLDEANTDRFCAMLEKMAKEGTTRFLVITHQRLTMSRMDRLYGVTMMEKGVSKLVSVDLREAVEIRGAA